MSMLSVLESLVLLQGSFLNMLCVPQEHAWWLTCKRAHAAKRYSTLDNSQLRWSPADVLPSDLQMAKCCPRGSERPFYRLQWRQSWC